MDTQTPTVPKYPLYDQATTLETLLVNTSAEVFKAHESMKAETELWCNNHNAAIQLMAGLEPYQDVWGPIDDTFPGTDIPKTFDPGRYAPMVGDIVTALKLAPSPTERVDPDMMRDRIRRVAEGDPAHPVVANWRVLQARCYPPAQVQPWPEVEFLATPAA
jgi:hypothetical protein